MISREIVQLLYYHHSNRRIRKEGSAAPGAANLGKMPGLVSGEKQWLGYSAYV